MESKIENTELKNAQDLIQKERDERLKAFNEELVALCEKHNCDLQVGGIQIIAK